MDSPIAASLAQPVTVAKASAPVTDTRRALRSVASVVPGLVVTAAIAGVAFLVRMVPGLALFSPMILATLLGMVLHNAVGTPAWAKAGVVFSLRRILRLGIILLGLQLMASQVAAVGVVGVCVIMATLLATFVFTKWFGRTIGVDPKLAELLAAGTSICGASAVIATNTVTQGKDEDVAYAVACVTVFGSLAIFLYPLLPGLLHLNPQAFGLWSGSSIHEIAQVVAAAFQDGAEAGGSNSCQTDARDDAGTTCDFARGPCRAAGRTHRYGQRRKGPPMPWFVLGFVALMVANSIVTIPASARDIIVPALTTFLLSMALAAMGMETDFRKLKAEGWKPLALAAALDLHCRIQPRPDQADRLFLRDDA